MSLKSPSVALNGTAKFPKGTRKIILIDHEAVRDNQQRAESAARNRNDRKRAPKWRPVYHVLEIADDGRVLTIASGTTFDARNLTPRLDLRPEHEQRDIPSRFRDLAVLYLETRGAVEVSMTDLSATHPETP